MNNIIFLKAKNKLSQNHFPKKNYDKKHEIVKKKIKTKCLYYIYA